MKTTKLLILTCALSLNTVFAQEKTKKNSSHPTTKELYFGEEPPGLVPKLFDPKIISPDGLFEGGKFTPDGKEYFFTRKNGKYKERTSFVIRYENGSWGNESETKFRWSRFSKGGDTLYLSLIHI